MSRRHEPVLIAGVYVLSSALESSIRRCPKMIPRVKFITLAPVNQSLQQANHDADSVNPEPKTANSDSDTERVKEILSSLPTLSEQGDSSAANLFQAIGLPGRRCKKASKSMATPIWKFERSGEPNTMPRNDGGSVACTYQLKTCYFNPLSDT
ncbi:hypothetical protein DFJ58DRAFT_840513 [Suillus subalutaceus]|uniref:uncharacterized protein n=1 Tax=Suillus subalutaceus TaxID=48586 RepID=UPI001B870A0B|nr:uncharacterized protein DFJ58DRAFT_840513 [Suillus subalutaceus]KAG1858048.1 hypothetical protein DFJ58DRAFT_840513 [Suillus subalutaceus]